MGHLTKLFFGGVPEPMPPVEDDRVRQVMDLLAERQATFNTRAVVHRWMWQRWAQGLAEAIVERIGEPAEIIQPEASAEDQGSRACG